MNKSKLVVVLLVTLGLNFNSNAVTIETLFIDDSISVAPVSSVLSIPTSALSSSVSVSTSLFSVPLSVSVPAGSAGSVSFNPNSFQSLGNITPVLNGSINTFQGITTSVNNFAEGLNIFAGLFNAIDDFLSFWNKKISNEEGKLKECTFIIEKQKMCD